MTQIAPSTPLIPRPRLLNRLREATERKLTLISAPPGYGKSVLVSQFAEQSSRPVLWHAIEAHDRDLPTLAARNLQVIDRAFPGTGESPLSPEATPGEAASKMAETLRQIRSDVVYVLDDIDHLYGAPGAENWLRVFIEVLPRNCHLVLLSRSVPDLPLIELMARQEVTAIGLDELRLTRAEIEALVGVVWDDHARQDVIDHIDHDLEGWPVGAVLSLYPMPEDFQRILLKGRAGPEALFEALAESMMDMLSPSLRDFLLASSTLTHMSSELLEDVLGLTGAREHLAAVQARNLFTKPSSSGVAYHALFRNFLQARFSATSPRNFHDLHLKAARYFHDDNRVEEAFRHYIAAQHHQEARDLAGHVAEAFYIQGKFETLLAWNAVLKTVSAASARLLYNCAAIHIHRYDHPLAEAELTEAASLCVDQPDTTLAARIEVLRAHNEMSQGKSAEAVVRLTKLLETRTVADAVRAHALSVLGHVRLQLGETVLALQIFQDALPLYRRHMSVLALAYLLQSKGVCHEQMGNLVEACACLQESAALLRSTGSKQSLALALTNLGYYYLLANNYQQAELTFEEGLSLITQAQERKTEVGLLWNLADLHRDLGHYAEAEKLYSRALRVLRQDDAAFRSYLLLSMALMMTWRQKWHEASSLATEAIALGHQGGLALQTRVGEILFLSAQAVLTGPADMLPLLEQAVDDLRQQHAKIKLMAGLAILARVAFQASRKSLARKYLQELVELTNETGVAQPAAAEIVNSQVLLEMCTSLAPGTALVRAIESLVNNRNASPEIKVMVTPSSPTLRVLTLGASSVFRGDHRISAAEWRSNAAREIFFYLLFEGPAHREKIGIEFWPEATSEQIRSNFHTAIKRARGAVGEKVIAFADDVYSLNSQIAYWCDALEFDNFVTQARALRPSDARAEDLLTRAVKFYHGDFLPESRLGWSSVHRDRLYDLYIEALLGLAACASSRDDARTALRYLKRALSLEPYREDIHRLILQFYADRGSKRRILDHYRILLESLRIDLNTAPSPETTELFNRLMG